MTRRLRECGNGGVPVGQVGQVLLHRGERQTAGGTHSERGDNGVSGVLSKNRNCKHSTLGGATKDVTQWKMGADLLLKFFGVVLMTCTV